MMVNLEVDTVKMLGCQKMYLFIESFDHVVICASSYGLIELISGHLCNPYEHKGTSKVQLLCHM